MSDKKIIKMINDENVPEEFADMVDEYDYDEDIAELNPLLLGCCLATGDVLFMTCEEEGVCVADAMKILYEAAGIKKAIDWSKVTYPCYLKRDNDKDIIVPVKIDVPNDIIPVAALYE